MRGQAAMALIGAAARPPALRLGPFAALAVAFAVTATVAQPPRVHAQAGAECAFVECARAPQSADARPAVRQLWAAASAAHELKLRFVDAVRQFLEAQAGTFGDEGPALAGSLRAMRGALGQWDDALRGLARAAAAEPAAGEAHVVLGTAYLDRHRVDAAVGELSAAVRLGVTRTEVQASLALAQTLQGRPAEAVRSLRAAVAIDPADAALAYTLAQRLRDVNRPEEALQALRRVVRIRATAVTVQATAPPGGLAAPFDRVELFRQAAGVAPIFPLHRYAPAFARLEAGDYDGAIGLLEAAVAGDPVAPENLETSAPHRLGSTLLREGRVAEALALLEPLAREPAASSEAHRVVALAMWVQGDHNQALEHLGRAVEMRPDDERARLERAFVLRAADRPSEAERELRDAVAALPQSGRARYQLGLLLESQSRLPDAAQAFEESTAMHPVTGRDHLLETLARVRVNQADFDRAIAAYAARVALNPNSAAAHRALGEIAFLQGRDDEALAEFTVAIWLDPSDARAHAAAGHVHSRAQRYGDAAAALARAVALDPSQSEAHYALGQALTRLGKIDEGRRVLAVFQQLQGEVHARGQRDFQVEQQRREAALRLASGEPAQALELLQQIVREDPGNPRWRRELGAALLRARLVADAIAVPESEQRLEASADGLRLLADAYALAGRAADSQREQARYDAAMQRARLERLRNLDAGQ